MSFGWNTNSVRKKARLSRKIGTGGKTAGIAIFVGNWTEVLQSRSNAFALGRGGQHLHIIVLQFAFLQNSRTFPWFNGAWDIWTVPPKPEWLAGLEMVKVKLQGRRSRDGKTGYRGWKTIGNAIIKCEGKTVVKIIIDHQCFSNMVHDYGLTTFNRKFMLLLLLELCSTWPEVTPPTLLELCRAWPAVTPPQQYLSYVAPGPQWDAMGAKSNPPPQPPLAASVHCMHIHMFNKLAVS